MNRRLTELARLMALYVRRDILAGTGGSVMARHAGSGLEFNGLREYLPTDDARHIHWPSLLPGRAVKLKEFREEQEITDCIALDVSRSMTFHEQNWHLATEVAALLAGLPTLCGTGGQLFRFTDHLTERLILKTGERELNRAVQFILPIPETSQPTHLARALTELANALGKPSRLFILSDFIGQDFTPQLKRLSHRHQTTLCHILPIDLHELPSGHVQEVQDAENNRRLFVKSDNCSDRQKHADRIRFLAQQHGAAYIRFDLETSPYLALRQGTCQKSRIKL